MSPVAQGVVALGVVALLALYWSLRVMRGWHEHKENDPPAVTPKGRS